MAALAALIWKGCKAVTSKFNVENLALKLEHLSSELAVEVARFRRIADTMCIDPPSCHGSHAKRTKRPILDPAIEQILPVVDHLLDYLQTCQEQFEIQDKGRRESSIQGLSRSMQHGLPLPEESQDSFRIRLRTNKQELTSILHIAWAPAGVRDFGEKIKKLGALLDDLEDVVRAVDDARCLTQPSTDRQSTFSDSQPPPYSVVDPAYSQSIPVRSRPRKHTCHYAVETKDPDPTRQKHYLDFKQYLLACPIYREHAQFSPLIEQSLRKISDLQFQGLRTDAHDELVQRQFSALWSSGSRAHSSMIPSCLPSWPGLSTIRQKARQAMSELPRLDFGDLISDIVVELERRFPVLKEERGLVQKGDSSHISASKARKYASRRLGYCAPRESEHRMGPPQYPKFSLSALNQVVTRPDMNIVVAASEPLPELVDVSSSIPTPRLSFWPAPINDRAFPHRNLI